MANERITENLVRDILRGLNYYNDSDILVEEQKSHIDEITRLLKGASKTGKGGVGAPEFIISTPLTPDFLIIFECKSNIKNHESKEGNKPKDYAVDGVLHYAKMLSKSYNIIAVAVSGETKSSLKISNFIYPKEASQPKVLENKSGEKIDAIVSLSDYIEHGTFDSDVAKKRENDLMSLSKELHDFMRDHAKLTEGEKPLLVSGILIALRNKAFSKSFDAYSPEDLQKEWMRVIKQEMKKADIPHSKEYSMTQPYSSIAVHPELGKPQKKYPRGVLFELIKMGSSTVLVELARLAGFGPPSPAERQPHGFSDQWVVLVDSPWLAWLHKNRRRTRSGSSAILVSLAPPSELQSVKAAGNSLK